MFKKDELPCYAICEHKVAWTAEKHLIMIMQVTYSERKCSFFYRIWKPNPDDNSYMFSGNVQTEFKRYQLIRTKGEEGILITILHGADTFYVGEEEEFFLMLMGEPNGR